jgi:hypothetical protein
MSSTLRSRASSLVSLSLVLAGIAIAGSAAFVARAADTTASVGVGDTITLSDLTSSFQIDGGPSTTQTKTSAVSMNVKTNRESGYTVTVDPVGVALIGERVGNTDTIPVQDLKVKDSAASGYSALDPVTATQVKSQGSESDASGDTITNDYQVDIPFVNADTYSATLSYVAATQ